MNRVVLFVYALVSFLLASSTLLLVRNVASVLSVRAAADCVRVCPPDVVPVPPDLPLPRSLAIKAIGKLAMNGSSCSGTVVGPPRGDGKRTILSAAHCVKRVGENVTFFPRDASPVRCTVIAIDRTTDISLILTDAASTLPYVLVADSTPSVGSPIWHAGFGQDNPANKEVGTVSSLPNTQGQVRYRLSVSPGDSGGGIMLDANGHVLSPVCCTTCLGCIGDVWGGSPENIHRMLKSNVDFLDLPPATMPPPPIGVP